MAAIDLRTRWRAGALSGAGQLAWARGQHAAAYPQLLESADIWRELGDMRGLGYSLMFLSNEILGRGDPESARPKAEEAVTCFRSVDDQFGLATSLVSAGIIALLCNELPEAEIYLQESATIARESGDNWALALALRNLGIVAFRRRQYARAISFLRQSLAVQQELPEKWFVSRSIETLAQVLAADGQLWAAAKLYGAAEALRERVGAGVLPFYQADYDRGLETLRSGLDKSVFERLWSDGRSLTTEEIIDYATKQPSLPVGSTSG